MATGVLNDVLRDVLTPAQVRFLGRHRRGLIRLAHVLGTKTGRAPTDIMLVLAHQQSRVGVLACELEDRVVTGRAAVVVPGLATELPAWIARLALAGPVYDCTSGSMGIPIIVIDEHDAMAVCRLKRLTAAGNSDLGNRPIISSE